MVDSVKGLISCLYKFLPQAAMSYFISEKVGMNSDINQILCHVMLLPNTQVKSKFTFDGIGFPFLYP